jgi:hypothetical protein
LGECKQEEIQDESPLFTSVEMKNIVENDRKKWGVQWSRKNEAERERCVRNLLAVILFLTQRKTYHIFSFSLCCVDEVRIVLTI